MHPFLSAVIGGALIGFSVVLLMFLSGRIAGISGIVGGLRGSVSRLWYSASRTSACLNAYLLSPREMSDLSPQSDPKRTLLGRSHLSRFYEYA
jgi:hypothetical protein